MIPHERPPTYLPPRLEVSLLPEVLPKRELDVGKARTLGELGMAFFTPAVLYLHGGFTDRTLVDYVRETGKELDLRYRLFRLPVFRGLHTESGDADWDHALWAVPAEDWPPLRAFLASLAFVDRRRRTFTRVGVQELEVADPLALGRPGVMAALPPTAKVAALGVDSCRGVLGFRTGFATIDRPALSRWPPRPETAAFAEAVFRQADPYKHTDPFLRGDA